jgi:hypothetical protein
MRLPSVSLEALIGIFVGLFVGLVEMNWELRSLGVLVASGLAVHITRRLYATILLKVAIAVIAIGLLAIGTYHQIWASFTDDFPTVTSETAITRIIEFLVLFILRGCGLYIYSRGYGLKGLPDIASSINAVRINCDRSGLRSPCSGACMAT